MKRIEDISKTFDPRTSEGRIYDQWVENGYFHAVPDKDKKPYTIMIPPPNITGELHMGHALDNTIQDILIRCKRMQGYSALWMPGTDHASIATETKIVENMAKEGLTKDDIGRKKFLERAWKWKDVYGGRITEQLKRLGSSCDWERERFTMDEGLSKAVSEVFVRLYEKGLIYRGERIINWCPKCLTSISDAEVEYEEKNGFLWHIKYPYQDGKGEITVATTRPETMLGDTAVAVNPSDERYSHIIGKNVILPLVDKPIPVIADDYVEKDFGTGALKITPAHDPNDFEVGQRHGLEVVNVINDAAFMNEKSGKYEGLDRYEARKRIVEDLEGLGLIAKIQDYKHNVGQCYRCSSTVEPKVSFQWFVKMKPLAGPAIDVVKKGEIKFVPERFDKIYFNWMENVRDWCISRQLWWGHPIPAYYCDECGEIIVSKDEPDGCKKCESKSLTRDPDTLDTWFSSALWPFSTLGWPEKTKELEYFYPTDVLVTAYDIIFFWVARMIFSALEHTDSIPFEYVLIHGIIRDEKGRKMSKSLGNGIDPLEIIDNFGADALRFSLINGSSPGSDQRFLESKAEAGRNFANKIWNAYRFTVMNFQEDIDFGSIDPKNLETEDKWILSRLNKLAQEATGNIEKFELGIALTKIYNFIWEEFCDWYIEIVKPRLFDEKSVSGKYAGFTLNHVLGASMKLLHPYMPFITEEIYSGLINDDDSVMISNWPVKDERFDFPEEERKMSVIMDAIRKIRNIRAEMNVPVSRKTSILVVSEDKKILEMFLSGKAFLERLASVNEIKTAQTKENISKTDVAGVFDGGEVFISLEELIDIKEEISRLESESKKLGEEIERADKKLSNESFISKAPEAIVNSQKEKREKYFSMKKDVDDRIRELKKI